MKLTKYVAINKSISTSSTVGRVIITDYMSDEKGHVYMAAEVDAILEKYKKLAEAAEKIIKAKFPHHLFCNYPDEAMTWCNCGMTDLRVALDAIKECEK